MGLTLEKYTVTLGLEAIFMKRNNTRLLVFSVILVALTFAAGFVSLSGCACRSPEKKNTPGCAFVNNVIDCTTAEIQSFMPKILPLIAFLLSGANGDPNWENYLIGAESMGLGAVACAAEVAMQDLTLKAAALPDGPDLPNGMMSKGRMETMAKKVIAANTVKNWQKWKIERVGSNVKFKTKN
jgi:hypothetical protein